MWTVVETEKGEQKTERVIKNRLPTNIPQESGLVALADAATTGNTSLSPWIIAQLVQKEVLTSTAITVRRITMP